MPVLEYRQLEGIHPEIAALRLKLRSSLQHDPANRRVRREAAKLLAKWYSAKHQLDRTDSRHLKDTIWSILENHSSSLTIPGERMDDSNKTNHA